MKVREAAFESVRGTVFAPRLRQQMLAAVPAYKLFLDTQPLPNEPYAANAATGIFQGAGSRRSSDDHWVVRPDFRITDRMLVHRHVHPRSALPGGPARVRGEQPVL